MKTVPPYDPNPCRPRHFKPGPYGPGPQEGPQKELIETSHTRLIIAGILLCLAFIVISARLIEVAGFKADNPRQKPDLMARSVEPNRASIVDRNGVLLATTLPASSLYADPKEVQNPREAARRLAKVLPGISEADLYRRLNAHARFVWIDRQLTPQQEAAVNRLGIPGLNFQKEDKRFYPQGKTAADVVGFTSIDNKGLDGVERGLNKILRTQHKPVQLSIDLPIQGILRDEVQRQVTTFHAIGGDGIIMNVHTGEILALVSLPDFDPNDPSASPPQNLFNRVTLGTYEIGSVFKIFTFAMALDEHVTTMTSSYNATHPIHIDGFTIHDDDPQNRWLSVPEIFMYSSNIGTAKIAREAGADMQRAFLKRLGLLTAPKHFQLDEIGTPILPAVWRPINTMTIGFGQGISVSALQVATAISAVVNGGIFHPATLLKIQPGQTIPGRRVISRQTSLDMRKLMRLVVEKGTGIFAQGSGYLIGGKTGTAEKVIGGRYARHTLFSSFAGVFPINHPQYLVMISLDEPHGDAQTHGMATGGWVAAPAVKRTVERIAPLLGIQPIDADSPEIRRSLMVTIPPPPGQQFAAN